MRKELYPIIAIMSAGLCQGQWQADTRLTFDAGASTTSSNTAKCVATNGDTVHIVWRDDRDGNEEIYYKRSLDGGVNWGSDTRLTNAPGSSSAPSIALSGTEVHLIWEDDRDGNDEVYYKRSVDGGTSWGADTRLTNNSGGSMQPALAASGALLHIAWRDDRDGNYEVYYIGSADAGVSWGPETRLTNNGAWSGFPSVTAFDDGVHVVWPDIRDGNFEVYYKASDDGGASWGPDTRLTNEAANSYDPFIIMSGMTGHIVWSDMRHGHSETYYKRSVDGGANWGPDTRLTNSTDQRWYPSAAVSGSLVHVVWYDERHGNAEIYHMRSTDEGASWEPETRLTTDSASSYSPSVAAWNDIVHVTWQDERDGNFEIYYKRHGNPVGIDDGAGIPEAIRLSPNPASTVLTVQRTGPLHGAATCTIRNSLGAELLSQRIHAEAATIDVADLPDGIYVLTIAGHSMPASTARLVIAR